MRKKQFILLKLKKVKYWSVAPNYQIWGILVFLTWRPGSYDAVMWPLMLHVTPILSCRYTNVLQLGYGNTLVHRCHNIVSRARNNEQFVFHFIKYFQV